MTKLSILVDIDTDPTLEDPEVVAANLLSDDHGDATTHDGEEATFLSATWVD